MDYKKVSREVTKYLGGKKNISLLVQCATRLHVTVKDKSLVNLTKLEEIDGVLGVIESDNIEIAIGTTVDHLFAAMAEDGVNIQGEVGQTVYNDVALWRLGFFAFNNTATNLYAIGMAYVSYYASGIAGLAVVTVGTALTLMRIFDGFTDPIVGYFIDKTDGKFGKFRPFMVAGNVILGIMTLIIYHTTHLVDPKYRLVYFIAMYAIYIIGYTFQTACTKAGQAAMTNNPETRPKFGLFDMLYNSIIMTGISLYVSTYLVPKHGGFQELALFHELALTVVIFSGILTALAVIGIWTKDRTEFFGLGEGSTKTTFKDYWPVLKGNRPLQMLIVAAGTDKIALSVAGNATVAVMLYGIIIGDFSLSGLIGMIVLVPTLLITLWGTKYAGKFGQKKALVFGTQASIVTYGILFLFFLLADPTQISLKNFGLTTALFLILLIISNGAKTISGAFVIPMISDCADYETYKSGRFVPGMMGTLFSFVDKLISSFASMVIAFSVAAIGFTDRMPDVTDSATPQIFWLTMALFIGLPVLGWIASLIAMKFYDLDKEKMIEVQKHIKSEKEKYILSQAK